MAIRKIAFVEGEFYHVYNRGVDKRDIFLDTHDIDRFMLSMQDFNTVEPIGSIYEHSFVKQKDNASQQLSQQSSMEKLPTLVRFVAYCLNPNHFHFLVEPVVERGVEQFMQRLGTGYTKYFNHRYKRTGGLFQGVFKSSHIDSNEYLLHVTAYINLNNHVHQLGSEASKLVNSSWGEYTRSRAKSLCHKDVILDQFPNRRAYEHFARSSLPNMIAQKKEDKELERLLLE